jgi:hypothetical protein
MGIAKQLKLDLDKYGLKIWMDENIIKGLKWDDSIRKNIRQ